MAPQKKSPSLEVVSDAGGGASADSLERRRRPRLNLSAEQFRLNTNGKIFSVADLSSEGMALRVLDRQDFNLFPVASVIEGTLNLKGRKFPVRARIRHLGADLIGSEFEEISAEVRAELMAFLDPEVLGREIRPIPASDPGTLWYHGPSGTDLLFLRGVDGKYRRLTLFVLGNFIQWDEELGLSTGLAQGSDSLSEVRGVVRFETMLLRPDARPDREKLAVAKALILSSNLPQDLKKWCVRQFEMN